MCSSSSCELTSSCSFQFCKDDGTAAPCYVSTSLDDIAADTSLSLDEAKQKEELIMDCASVMYGAATDSVSLRCFFHA